MKRNAVWIIVFSVFLATGITTVLLYKANYVAQQTVSKDASSKAGENSLPSVEKCKQMALETTLILGQAIKVGDFSSFYSTASQEFRNSFSLKQFTQAFDGFLQQKTNLSAVKNYDPVFILNPNLSEDGTLVLQGYFPTQPSRIYFDYQFLRSSNEWRLSGININVKPLSNL